MDKEQLKHDAGGERGVIDVNSASGRAVVASLDALADAGGLPEAARSIVGEGRGGHRLKPRRPGKVGDFMIGVMRSRAKFGRPGRTYRSARRMVAKEARKAAP